jgi:predicted acetyltransferase
MKPVIAEYLRNYLDEFGFRGAYPYFEDYWREPTRHPILILSRDEPVGFAFVRELEDPPALELAEFYVEPGHRRSGIGRRALEALLGMFPGTWHVPVQISNLPGLAFWSSVLCSPVPNTKQGDTVVVFHVERDFKRDAA